MAVKRKRRIFRKFMNSGRRPEDWEKFKIVRNEAYRMDTNAKEMYCTNLGQKLSDATNGTKTFWSTMNRLTDITKNINVPPLSENGLSLTNIEVNGNIFNEYFVQMWSEKSTTSTLPSFVPRSQNRLEGLPSKGRVFVNSAVLWIAKTLMVAMEFLLLWSTIVTFQ